MSTMGYLEIASSIPSTFLSPKDEFRFENYTHRCIIACLVSIIAVVGIVGNALVITAVVLSRKLRTKTNVFVVNLSASDFISCAVLPFHVYTILDKGDHSQYLHWLCVSVSIATFASVGTCIVTLMLISINRYYKIKKPQKYDKVFCKWAIACMIIGSWVYPIVLICGSLPFDGGYGYTEKYRVCTRMGSDKSTDLINLLANVLLVVPTFLITFIAYALIHAHVRQHNARRLAALFLRLTSSKRNKVETINVASSSQNSAAPVLDAPQPSCNASGADNGSSSPPPNQPSFAQLQTEQTRARIRHDQMEITKSLFLIVCVHLILVAPFAAAIVITGSARAVPWVFTVFLATPASNPFVYGWKHPHFKLVFKAMLTCRPSKIPQPSGTARYLTRGHRPMREGAAAVP